MKSNTLKLEGLVPVLEEYSKNIDAITDRVQTFIKEHGLSRAEQPMRNGKPLVPDIPRKPDGSPSLEMLGLTELSNLYAECNAYLGYVIQLLLDLKSDLLSEEEKLAHIESYLKSHMPPPEASKKDRVKLDPKYEEQSMVVLQLKKTILRVTASRESIDSTIFYISREVTMRKDELARLNREENMGRKPYNLGGNSGIPGGKQVR